MKQMVLTGASVCQAQRKHHSCPQWSRKFHYSSDLQLKRKDTETGTRYVTKNTGFLLFFLIKVAQMRWAFIYVISYLQLHWAGLRCCIWASSRACGLQHLWSSGSSAWAQCLWLTGSAALWHVKPARTRDQASVSCIPRRVLNHCATREASSIRDMLRKLRSCNF